MIGWIGEGDMTTGDTCWACFETDGDGKSIKEGDRGVGACYNSDGSGVYNGTNTFTNFGTIKARSANEFMSDENQGWNPEWANL